METNETQTQQQNIRQNFISYPKRTHYDKKRQTSLGTLGTPPISLLLLLLILITYNLSVLDLALLLIVINLFEN